MSQVAVLQDTVELTKFMLPEARFKLFSQENRSTKDSYASPKFLQQTKTFASSSSQSNKTDAKQLNDLEVFSLTLSYCLNYQAQMANSLVEISQYLKQCSEKSDNIMKKPQSKPFSLSKAPPSSSLSVQSERAKEKPAFDSCLLTIMAKLEEIKSGIQTKAQEYEKWQGLHYPSNTGQSKTELTGKLYHKDTLQLKTTASIQFKHSMNPPIHVKTESNIQGLYNLGLNTQLTNLDARLDTSMMSKYDDIQSSENSQIVNHNVPATNSDAFKPSKNFERANLNTGVLTPVNQKVFTSRNSEYTKETQTTTKAHQATNTSKTASNSKKVFVPPIKLKLNSISTPNYEAQYNTFGSKAQAQTERQSHNLDCQSFRSNTLRTESECIEFVTDQENKPLPTSAFSKGNAYRESPKGPGYGSPTDRILEYNAPKDSARLRLSTLPQKDVVDEPIENALDQTMRIDSSMLSIDEKPHHTPWMTYLNDERSIESMRTPRDDANLIMTRKEREIIKAIMKGEYGAETSYHKADHGKLYEKKYLINAKWWREWKDFVNFDAEEDELTQRGKGSFLSVKTYARPGPINNCELLRRDFIRDPVNLAPELELKENLLEHHDYEAVNKKIHGIFTTWYGSDFEICRVLRPDPFHNNKPYLDLYPRKKQDKRQIPKSMDVTNGGNYVKLFDKIINLNLKHPE